MYKRDFYNILYDILFLIVSFIFVVWLKPASKSIVLPSYLMPFLGFFVIWIIVSVVFNKYGIKFKKVYGDFILPVIKSLFVILAIVGTMLFAFKQLSYSRLIVLGTIFLAFGLEFIYYTSLYFYVNYSKKYDDSSKKQERFFKFLDYQKLSEQYDFNSVEVLDILAKDSSISKYNSDTFYKDIIEKEVGKSVYKYIDKYVDVKLNENLIISTTTKFNIENKPDNKFQSIINLKRINDIRRINKFFEAVNSKLPVGGIYVGCVETFRLKKIMIISKYPFIIGQLIYLFYFIFRRFFPKVLFLKKIFFFLTKGRGRAMSKAETLGRLVSCGFEIINYETINNLLYFVARKEGRPVYDLNPSYGPLFRMKRFGKNGKIIFVYKFRTMHPYAEYLQDYVLKISGYSNIGKPADDFRVTTWGKFLRKFWLDELPQLLNVLKGEMGLVGVRPLSQRFLKEYPSDILKIRQKYKPGCVPPYVALIKQDVKEYIESERIYLRDKEKHPFFTDIKYLFKAIYNILTNKIRSA